MPPMSNENSQSAGSSDSQHQMARDAEELRDRARQFLSKVAPTLDSIEALLDSWNRYSEASSSSCGLPGKSSFRTVHIDSFTVQAPPPTVSEAEITQYIKNLSNKDMKTLDDEFDLTCVDEFEYVHSGEDAGDGEEAASRAAARIVHFSNGVPSAREDDGETGAEEHELTQQALPLSVSPTTRARTLFESEGASVDRLGLNSIGHITEVHDEVAPAPATQTPPAFSLEQMSPSAVAAHEHRRTASSDSSHSSAMARPPTAAGLEATKSYTVEINYNADHFFPSAVQRALRDGAGSAIMVKPSSQQGSKVDGTADFTQHTEAAAQLLSDSDEEVAAADADIQSFTAFSRMVLANEGRRLTSQRAPVEVPASTDNDTRPSSAALEEKRLAESAARAVPPPVSTTSASIPATSRVSVKVVQNAEPRSARDAFIRQRVRDILLANRVRTADTAALGTAFFEKLVSGWNAAANQTTPVLQKLDEMLCESSALLHTLEVMDHQAYRERVMDPSQYLCVPRHSVSCAAPDCNTAFSATTTRVMCGRCGQSFCPACCVERGLGPDVLCDGQRYSLGWEPLCRICYQMCRDSQAKLVQERQQYLRIANGPTHGEAVEDDGAEEAARRASLESLTLKQAVLFGAYCDDQRCLGDGLPPFYVMDRVANEGVVFWDILRYQFAKTQGSFRRGWQSAGNMATHAVQSATQMVSNRRGKLQ